MSHKDFIASLAADDGKKWILEERNGASFYIEDVPNPYNTGKLRKKNRAAPPKDADGGQKWRGTKPEKGYSCRLGYNMYCAQYTGDVPAPFLSGSSLNRKKAERSVGKPPNPNAVHRMSKRSKAKVKDKMTAMFRATSGARTFLTLGFIEHIEDKAASKLFNTFMTSIRKSYPGITFIRVAEHQPKRKEHTIHFHCILDRRLPVKWVNGLWTMIQYKAGLRGYTKTGRRIEMEEMQKAYRGWKVGKLLNPADIKQIKDVNGLAAYLTAYVTKKPNDEEFGCLTWHCSRKVSRLFTRQLVTPSTFRYLQSPANFAVDKNTGECWPPEMRFGNFYQMIYVNNKEIVLPALAYLEKANEWIMGGLDPGEPHKMDDDDIRKHRSRNDTAYNNRAAVGAVPA